MKKLKKKFQFYKKIFNMNNINIRKVDVIYKKNKNNEVFLKYKEDRGIL